MSERLKQTIDIGGIANEQAAAAVEVEAGFGCIGFVNGGVQRTWAYQPAGGTRRWGIGEVNGRAEFPLDALPVRLEQRRESRERLALGVGPRGVVGSRRVRKHHMNPVTPGEGRGRMHGSMGQEWRHDAPYHECRKKAPRA